MAAIKLRISVRELDNVMTLFDQIKVYRSTTGPTGTYVEITGVGTRVNLVAGTTLYTYDDTAGDPGYYYKTSYFNSTTSAESSLSDPIKGEGTGNYISIQDIRDEGVTVAQASDARVLAVISVWERFIDKETGQWFYPRDLIMSLDGNDSDVLFLPVPIISLTSLTINGEATALDPSLYVVYSRFAPDDRHNPRVKLLRLRSTDLFQRLAGDHVFLKGQQNQQLVGTFGFVEPDGSAPKLIKYAATRLVLNHLPQMGAGGGGGATPAGPVIEEWTDGHKIKYAEGGSSTSSPSGTGDQEIDNILAEYRRPIALGTVRNWAEPVIIK